MYNVKKNLNPLSIIEIFTSKVSKCEQLCCKFFTADLVFGWLFCSNNGIDVGKSGRWGEFWCQYAGSGWWGGTRTHLWWWVNRHQTVSWWDSVCFMTVQCTVDCDCTVVYDITISLPFDWVSPLCMKALKSTETLRTGLKSLNIAYTIPLA